MKLMILKVELTSLRIGMQTGRIWGGTMVDPDPDQSLQIRSVGCNQIQHETCVISGSSINRRIQI